MLKGISDFFKSLSLGLINILGIIFPGTIFILMFILIILIPTVFLIEHVNDLLGIVKDSVEKISYMELYKENRVFIIIFLILLSYALGYIIRLSTVDELDEKSAKHVLNRIRLDHEKEKGKNQNQDSLSAEQLEQKDLAEKEGWPFRLDSHDKFPYFHFKDYLEKRGLYNQAQLVTWEKEPFPEGEEKVQRSKAIINQYKIQVHHLSPELSAIIKANEAHIRLLFGIWSVNKMYKILNIVFGSICISITLLSLFDTMKLQFNIWAYVSLIQIIIFILINWSSHRIVKLFHYQRVKEITQILTCTHIAKSSASDENKPWLYYLKVLSNKYDQ